MKNSFLVLLCLFCCSCTTVVRDMDVYNHELYYTAPASIWEEMLPFGNGRLGMMPSGGVRQECIMLNEISLWSGSESDYGNPEAAKSLPAIRKLLFEGKNREAQELMYRSFVPKKQETDGRYGSYQALGRLLIDFTYDGAEESEQDYRRSLSLRDATAYTSFRLGDVCYTREYFVSRAHDVMMVHLKADVPGALNFTAQLDRLRNGAVSRDGESLVMEGTLDSGNPGKRE